MQLRWVPVMFFGCGGGVAALRGYLQGMPVSNLYFQLFLFSGGLGFLVGNLYRAYRQR
jgi:hypothetical protein